jgi:hypothetical protein
LAPPRPARDGTGDGADAAGSEPDPGPEANDRSSLAAPPSPIVGAGSPVPGRDVTAPIPTGPLPAAGQRGAVTMVRRQPLPPPRADTSWPSLDDVDRRRKAWRQRAILLIGYALVAVGLGVIANTAWLLGTSQAWVAWTAVSMTPAVLTGIAALAGWRYTLYLALFAAAWYVVVAVVALVLQPSVGLPQLACGAAAVAVTAAAWAASPPQEPEGEPSRVNTAG